MRIGTDLCNPKRIEKTYQEFGEKFLDRILTPGEKQYVTEFESHLISRLAARYAAKEAVAKALGIGIREGVNFKDIEILNGDKNAPYITLHGDAMKASESLGLKEWAISISHEDIVVVAMVVAS